MTRHECVVTVSQRAGAAASRHFDETGSNAMTTLDDGTIWTLTGGDTQSE
jgi:hypothetical protein